MEETKLIIEGFLYVPSKNSAVSFPKTGKIASFGMENKEELLGEVKTYLASDTSEAEK